MCNKFFMIEIESFSSRCDCYIILETEYSIYSVDILFMWFSSFCCLKFSLVFLMFLYVISDENMFRFSFWYFLLRKSDFQHCWWILHLYILSFLAILYSFFQFLNTFCRISTLISFCSSFSYAELNLTKLS